MIHKHKNQVVEVKKSTAPKQVVEYTYSKISDEYPFFIFLI